MLCLVSDKNVWYILIKIMHFTIASKKCPILLQTFVKQLHITVQKNTKEEGLPIEHLIMYDELLKIM